MFADQEAGIVPETPSGSVGLAAPMESSLVPAAAEQVARRTLANPMLVELLNGRFETARSEGVGSRTRTQKVILPEHANCYFLITKRVLGEKINVHKS